MLFLSVDCSPGDMNAFFPALPTLEDDFPPLKETMAYFPALFSKQCGYLLPRPTNPMQSSYYFCHSSYIVIVFNKHFWSQQHSTVEEKSTTDENWFVWHEKKKRTILNWRLKIGNLQSLDRSHKSDVNDPGAV